MLSILGGILPFGVEGVEGISQVGKELIPGVEPGIGGEPHSRWCRGCRG